MKNFILLLLLLLYPIQAFTQIKTSGTIEMGYEDKIIRLDDGVNTLYQSLWLKQAEFAAINLNASYKNLSVYTDVKTLFKSETFYKYDALQVEYKLGMNYEIGKNKRFLFNLEHFCSHSIESRQVYYFYDKISVKINIW